MQCHLWVVPLSKFNNNTTPTPTLQHRPSNQLCYCFCFEFCFVLLYLAHFKLKNLALTRIHAHVTHTHIPCTSQVDEECYYYQRYLSIIEWVTEKHTTTTNIPRIDSKFLWPMKEFLRGNNSRLLSALFDLIWYYFYHFCFNSSTWKKYFVIAIIYLCNSPHPFHEFLKFCHRKWVVITVI